MTTREKILEILEKTHLMSLGVQDSGGVWVSDVIFVYDEDTETGNINIYWMSDPEVRHSVAIAGNPRVAGTITATQKSGEMNLGIQFSGMARKIDGPRYDLAIKHFAKRGHPAPREDEDVLQGDSWYMLTPEKIDLIDEENLGFEKQFLVID